MRNQPALWLAVLMLIATIRADVYISVELQEYKNGEGRKQDSSCCDITGSDCSADPCDQIFNLCLDNSTSSECQGTTTTFEIPVNTNSYSFPSNSIVNSGSSYNPTTFKITKWMGSTSLKIVVFDSDTDSNGKISLQPVDVLTADVVKAIADKGQADSQYMTMTLVGNRTLDPTSMTIRVAVFCNNNFFGKECSTFCLPANSCTGHFTCDPDTGDKVCMEGWMGHDCTVAKSGMSTCPASYVTIAPPTTVTAAPCDTLDLIFLVDNSGTVSEVDPNNWAYMQKFMKKFADLMSISPYQSQIGAVVYGNNGVLRMKLSDNDNIDSVKLAIDQLVDHKQKTNVIDGIKVTLNDAFSIVNGGRSNAKKVVVMITDGGQANAEFGDPMSNAASLRNAGIDTYVVSHNFFITTGKSDKGLLEEIASTPLSSHLFVVANFTDISETIPASILATNRAICAAPSTTIGPHSTTVIPTNGPKTNGPASSTKLPDALLPSVTTIRPTNPFFTTLPAGVANAGTTLPPTSMEGTWEGTYTCSGTTMMLMATLKKDAMSSDFLGTLSFANGSMNAVQAVQAVSESNMKVVFTPLGFKVTPPNDVKLLALSGTIDSAFKVITGDTLNQGCQNFTLKRVAQSYCRNGGSCIRFGPDQGNVYCCCPNGYKGTYCESEMDPCETANCGSGTCVAGNGTHYTCSCPDGYAGNDCSIVVVDITCVDSPCLNNGSCSNTTSGFECTCLPAFKGVKCEQEIKMPVPCPEFYYGVLCDIRCKASDSCLDGHYTCSVSNGDKICNAGFTGTDCKTSDSKCGKTSPSRLPTKSTTEGFFSTTPGFTFHGDLTTKIISRTTKGFFDTTLSIISTTKGFIQTTSRVFVKTTNFFRTTPGFDETTMFTHGTTTPGFGTNKPATQAPITTMKTTLPHKRTTNFHFKTTENTTPGFGSTPGFFSTKGYANKKHLSN